MYCLTLVIVCLLFGFGRFICIHIILFGLIELSIMRRLSVFKCLILLQCGFVLFLLYNKVSSSSTKRESDTTTQSNFINFRIIQTEASEQKKRLERIVVSFVVCDTRFNESLNVVKSVLLFTRTPVYFVIFSDDLLTHEFNETMRKWKILSQNQLDFEIQRINFPEENREDWLNLFRKCAAQRLFIPKLITHIDAMIYVDTDTLFLGPVDHLWDYFTQFNTSQISAMTLEDENPNVSWYPRFAKHPFYGKYGLNSGVMLMNLTRMRTFGWTDYVTPIMLKWKLYIPWGDQDIINIIFHYHPWSVLVLPCRCNYRTDQCMYGDACAGATRDGALVLHASRQAFHNNKQPAFQAVYKAINEYEVGTDPSRSLLRAMNRYFDEAPPSNCGALRNAFLKLPTQTFRELYDKPDYY